MRNLAPRGLATLFLGLLSFSVSAITLDELISHALISYPSVLARQSNRSAAQSDLTAAKLKFLPNPSLSTQRNNVRFDGVKVPVKCRPPMSQ